MRTATLLIYETDSAQIEKYENALSQLQLRFKIKIVQTLRSFLEELTDFNPQVILLQSTMQGLGEILLGLRQNHKIKAPIILIGELERESDFTAAIQSGAFDYIANQSIYRLANSVKNAINSSK